MQRDDYLPPDRKQYSLGVPRTVYTRALWMPSEAVLSTDDQPKKSWLVRAESDFVQCTFTPAINRKPLRENGDIGEIGEITKDVAGFEKSVARIRQGHERHCSVAMATTHR